MGDTDPYHSESFTRNLRCRRSYPGEKTELCLRLKGEAQNLVCLSDRPLHSSHFLFQEYVRNHWPLFLKRFLCIT